MKIKIIEKNIFNNEFSCYHFNNINSYCVIYMAGIWEEITWTNLSTMFHILLLHVIFIEVFQSEKLNVKLQMIFISNDKDFVNSINTQQLPQEKFENFPRFEIKKCRQINITDPSYPYCKRVFLDFHIDQDFIPRLYIGNDWPRSVVSAYLAAFFIEAVNIYYIKNGFVGNDRLIVSDYYNFIDVTNTNVKLQGVYNKYAKYNTTHGYRYVLTAITSWGFVFGHMFTDVFGPLIFLDESIWDLKPILCLPTGILEVGRLFLDAMGHTDIECRILNKEIIYAEHLYAVSGYAKHCVSGFYTMPILREYLHKYYNLEKSKPTNYGFVNKRVGRRHFTNLKELIETFQQQYNISFIPIHINQPNRREFAKTVSTLKIWVSSCGSIGFNCVFMKEKTGIFSLSAGSVDIHHFHFTLCIKMWHVSVIHPKMTHYGKSGMANITRCIYSFNVLWYAVENQKWPKNNNLFLPMNETIYREYAGNTPNFNLDLSSVINHLYDIYVQNPQIPK